MKISEIFKLDKTQAELDFVDIDTSKDITLFLDPHFLSLRNDRWSQDALSILRSFFQEVIDLIMKGKESQAKSLFSHLHEPNSTCLGMSIGKPQGRGVGSLDTEHIYNSIISSKAIQTGLIQDIEDNVLFVDGFGKDKLSDMTTNILTGKLIEYTQEQCKLHEILLTSGISSGYYWNKTLKEWESKFTDMLIIENRKILLVPKAIVSFSRDYTPQKYYNNFVLDFLQNEEIRMNSALVQMRKSGIKYVTKKDIKQKHPISKQFLMDITNEFPELLENFKKNVSTKTLNTNDVVDKGLNTREVANNLVGVLRNIETGNEEANRYHSLIMGILTLLFYPHLIHPVKEKEIYSGRKRIDITFDNASSEGIFRQLSENNQIPCGFIFIECKNYTGDVANPELDQLAGRFSFNTGKFGFLLCRNIKNKNLFIERCKDTFKADRGLIIPLIDDDIINMLENYDEDNWDYIDNFLAKKVREVML